MQLKKLHELIPFRPTWHETDILYELFKKYDIQDILPSVQILVDDDNRKIYHKQFNGDLVGYFNRSLLSPLSDYDPFNIINSVDSICVYDCLLDDIRNNSKSKEHVAIRTYLDMLFNQHNSPIIYVNHNKVMPYKLSQRYLMLYYFYFIDL
ncbi:MAG TPA: hypothetical protein VK590_05470, partial [Saprospiraceae bacterium]|nr:hypothetical protein [Saprospiraceae bacterium]